MMSHPREGNSLNRDVDQIQVVLIEDDELVLEKLIDTVRKSPALKLLGYFSDAEAALRKIPKLVPNVVVTDLMLPGRDGIACTAAIKQALPATQVLILTAFSDTNLVMGALKAGASGYLIKRNASEELVHAIQDIWEGGSPMNSAIARKVVESFHNIPLALSGPRETLTPREDAILRLLSQGFAAKEIAGKLFISYATVRFHLQNIYEKLHVNNRAQAILKYLS